MCVYLDSHIVDVCISLTVILECGLNIEIKHEVYREINVYNLVNGKVKSAEKDALIIILGLFLKAVNKRVNKLRATAILFPAVNIRDYLIPVCVFQIAKHTHFKAIIAERRKLTSITEVIIGIKQIFITGYRREVRSAANINTGCSVNNHCIVIHHILFCKHIGICGLTYLTKMLTLQIRLHSILGVVLNIILVRHLGDVHTCGSMEGVGLSIKCKVLLLTFAELVFKVKLYSKLNVITTCLCQIKVYGSK